VKTTSPAAYGGGATKRSALLVPVPPGVVTDTRPEPVEAGTVVPMLVLLTDEAAASVALSRTFVLPVAGSKLAPAIVSADPVTTIGGAKPLTIGGPEPGPPTVKDSALVADPDGAVIAIGPVVAPGGTVVTICVAVLEVTVADTPLNVTAFWLGVALNPVPDTVTTVPGGPLAGEKSTIDATLELRRAMARRFPTAS
jgi:hypothetical protein